MEKTAYHFWLNQVTSGDEILLAALIKENVVEDANPQAYALLDETGDKAYTNETFVKAAKLITEMFKK